MVVPTARWVCEEREMSTVTEAAADTTPDLETGWQAGTPTDDTVLRHGMLALAAAFAATAEVGGGRVHHGDGWEAADLGRPTGILNSATLVQPRREADLLDTVDRITRFYDQRGRGAALLWSPWPTPDLTERGWALQGHPPLLHRPPGLPVTRPQPAGLELVDVGSAEELAEWCRVAVASFPFTDVDPPEGLLAPAVLADDRFRFVLARAGGRSVGVGSHVVVRDANVLLLSAVDPEHRGCGAYAALVADRLARHPQLPSVTIVSDDSRPILVSRFGFLPIARWTLWERPRS
jgi:hypothetical protein